MVVRGDRTQTAEAARTALGALGDVVWVGGADGVDVSPVSARSLQRRLGSSCRAAVLDLHEGFDGDALGRVHGLVRGGGTLVLRLPAESLSGRMGRWVEARLPRSGSFSKNVDAVEHGGEEEPTLEQDSLVRCLRQAWDHASPTTSVVTADRGRGKSAGVGRALAAVPPSRSVAVVAPHPRAADEVLRFADRPGLTSTSPLDLLAMVQAGPPPAIVVVDEAATLPVPLLQALCEACPTSHIVLATTLHGYEGSGRGFLHRVLPWLRTQARPVARHTLSEPIRWSAGDLLERAVFDLLALDAVPAASLDLSVPPRAECLDRERLIAEPGLLRQVFGLLATAHYRTTPSDLHHLLDDPNVALHVVWLGTSVAAVGWLVADGGLDEDAVARVAHGHRLRGHALADSLISHAGRPEAGPLRMWRSVRTAVHPAARGRGLARLLVAHEHEHHGDADLIGTLFGATAGLIAFRRALGYRVVRLGVSRSPRSGAPSVMMLRPHSQPARRLVDHLRRDLARDLPGLLRGIDQAHGLPLSSDLKAALHADLPPASVWTPATLDAAIARYVDGATPLDVLVDAPRLWLAARAGWAEGMVGWEARAVEARVVHGRPWREVATACGGRSVRVVQRGVRRALRTVWLREGAATDHTGAGS